MKKEICSTLAEIEKLHNVKILYACESGSRAWGRIISGIRDLLRTGFPDRAVYLKKLISQLKFLALSSVTNLLCCSYDTDQSEIPHNFSSGRRVIVNGRF